MNLYNYHKNPEDLHRHDSKEDHVIELFWGKYFGNSKELKKREKTIARDSHYSLIYAKDILKGRFPLGEPAIAKSSHYSYLYAKDVLHGKFPLGEPTIAKSSYYSYLYARDVLHGKFPLGEPEIVKKANLWKEYCEIFGIKE
jgi:hypothetical protein